MATIEKKGILTYVDDSGNMTLLYPVTTADAVDGLGDIISDVYTAINKTAAAAVPKVFTATLTANNWTGNTAPYTQRIGIDGILSTDRPHYGAVYAADNETRMAQKEAFSLVDDLDTENGAVIFTCFEDKPEVDIPIQMEVNR